jgi:hypothetical protein
MSILRSAAVVVAICLFSSSSRAGAREECVEAHGRAQDLRERGQLARAKQTFLICAQSSCPTLVQQDCARNSEELGQLVPTVTFSARDGSATDLPITTVYVDDTLFASRLDDGRTYEVDPGKHTIRFVHDGKETSLKVVLNQGERGRLLVATFVEHAPPRRESIETTELPSNEPSRSAFPLVVAGVGAAAAVTGGVLFALGSEGVPGQCSTSTRECAAPPNDPSLAKAESSVRLANTGLAIGISGTISLVGGLIWYFVQPKTTDSKRGRIGGPLFTF